MKDIIIISVCFIFLFLLPFFIILFSKISDKLSDFRANRKYKKRIRKESEKLIEEKDKQIAWHIKKESEFEQKNKNLQEKIFKLENVEDQVKIAKDKETYYSAHNKYLLGVNKKLEDEIDRLRNKVILLEKANTGDISSDIKTKDEKIAELKETLRLTRDELKKVRQSEISLANTSNKYSATNKWLKNVNENLQATIKSLEAKIETLELANIIQSNSNRENEKDEIFEETSNYINEIEKELQSVRSDLEITQKEKDELQSQLTKLEESKIGEYDDFWDVSYTALHRTIDEYKQEFSSNKTAIPYMAKIIAEIETIDLKRTAKALSWGNNQERRKKVAHINEIKAEAQEKIESLKWAEYQLAYLLELYPSLQDVIDSDFESIPQSFEIISEHDPVRDWLSLDEWKELSETDRSQLALDRYIQSHQKSKWQVGRDYELFCGHCYEKKGYTVEYFGEFMGLEDMGRDLIVRNGQDVRIVQCKYWSKNKQIHEKHVMQLFGSVVEYNSEHNASAKGILVTNTTLSEKARKFAEILGIMYTEEFEIGDFPRIKCNIGEHQAKIYHLPMDANYDVTKIDRPGEFMAYTVEQAEAAGFRRAYKWHGGWTISIN